MIITCPNCSTHYNVQPALIGKGRSTRCFNCGHTWYQGPVVLPPPPPMQPQPLQLFPTSIPPLDPQPAAYPQPDSSGQGMGNIQASYNPYQQFMPQPGSASDPAAMPPLPMPPSNLATTEGPVSDPEPEPNPSSDDSSTDDADISHINDPTTEADATDNDAEIENISDDELDEMFGDNEDLASVASIMGGGATANQNGGGIDPEDMPEPEPLPQMINPQEAGDAPPAKRSILKLIGIGVGGFLIISLAVLYFARGMIIDLFPFTNAVYGIVGLGEKIGAGLNLGKPKTEYATEDGKPILVIQGVIANISEDTRPVPMLKVVLRDADKNEVQSKIAPPARSELPAGERIRYKINIIEPSPQARGIAVIFVKSGDLKEN